MLYTIARTFEKKRQGSNVQGRIGNATLRVDIAECRLNGEELPRSSIEHLLNFSLQTLQDAYAGAETLTDAVDAFEAKLGKLIGGTLGARGEGVDSFTKVARQVVRAILKKNSSEEKFKAFTDLDAREQTERLDAIFATNEERLRPVVETEIEKRKAAAEEAKKLADGMEIAL